MNGKVFGWLIKPDQMQVVNPFLILALIPIFDQILYPALKKVNILTKPLQRLTMGGILAGVAFIISGVLELHLEPTYAVKLTGLESQVHFINTLPCTVTLTINGELESRSIDSLQMTIFSKIPATNYDGSIAVDLTNAQCKLLNNNVPFKFIAESGKAFSFVIEAVNETITVSREKSEDELEKSQEGKPKLKMLISGMLEEVEQNATLLLINEQEKVLQALSLKANASKTFDIDGGRYHFQLFIPANETINRAKKTMNVSGTLELELGGNYIFIVMKSSSGDISVHAHTITEPNSIHMLWLLPQYTVITIGEVMFSVTGLEFSFAQAPGSMKSVIQAAWLLTVAGGNLIVVFITEFIKFDRQSKEFFLFAGLMFIDMIVFAIMAYFYKPSKPDVDETSSSPDIPMDAQYHDNRTFDKE